MAHLIDNGIETRTYYPIPLHLQDCYKGLGYKEGDIKESEKACNEAFSIPIYSEITEVQREFIVDKISGFLA